MSDALRIGQQLVDLCRQGKHMEAINTLYGQNVVSVEAMEMPDMPSRLEGLEAVRGKGEWWMANHEIHSQTVDGPYPHGDRFIVFFAMEVTAKIGPMAGQRMSMSEAALYTVKGGKVVQEEFFYAM